MAQVFVQVYNIFCLIKACYYTCETCNTPNTIDTCLTCSSTNHRTLTDGNKCPCDNGFYNSGTLKMCQSTSLIFS